MSLPLVGRVGMRDGSLSQQEYPVGGFGLNCEMQRFEATGLEAVAFVCFAVARLLRGVRVEAYERHCWT